MSPGALARDRAEKAPALRRAATVRGRWDDGVMSRKVRYPVTGVTEAPAGSAMRIRARFRCSAADAAVLEALARYLSRLQGRDLAVRCAAGPAHDTVAWAGRKRALTGQCSSRFAGWITKSSNDAYAAARRNQRHVHGTAQGLRAHRRGGGARQASPRAPRPEEGTGKSRCDRRRPEDRSRRPQACSCGELPRARTPAAEGTPPGTRRSPAAPGHWPKAGTPARPQAGQTRSGNRGNTRHSRPAKTVRAGAISRQSP
jgi:hypothetical protein